MKKIFEKLMFNKTDFFISFLIKQLKKRSVFYEPLSRIMNIKIYNMYKKSNSNIPKYKIKELINKKNPTIVEIGANTGGDSISMLQVFRNNIQLHCIEPSPGAIKKFKEGLSQYKKGHNINCKLYEIAISNKNGFCPFYLDEHDPNYGNGTLKKLTLKASKAINYTGFQNNFNRQIKVKTMTLDDWAKENKIDTIDFMWTDMEGSEKQLIEGGLETLNKKTRFLYLEHLSNVFRFEKGKLKSYAGNESIWEGQITLREALDLLPNFEIIGIFGINVLLKNMKLSRNT